MTSFWKTSWSGDSRAATSELLLTLRLIGARSRESVAMRNGKWAIDVVLMLLYYCSIFYIPRLMPFDTLLWMVWVNPLNLVKFQFISIPIETRLECMRAYRLAHKSLTYLLTLTSSSPFWRQSVLGFPSENMRKNDSKKKINRSQPPSGCRYGLRILRLSTLISSSIPFWISKRRQRFHWKETPNIEVAICRHHMQWEATYDDLLAAAAGMLLARNPNRDSSCSIT